MERGNFKANKFNCSIPDKDKANFTINYNKE